MIVNDLAGLLAPVPIAEFLEAHWGQAPLLIARQEPNYYAGVLDVGAMDALFAQHTLRPSDVRFLEDNRRPAPAPRQWQPGDDRALYDAYLEGATPMLKGLERWQPALAGLCRTLEQFFYQRVYSLVFPTPAGAQSSRPHYDTDDVFVLQLAGSKSWRVYEPGPPLPLPGAAFSGEPEHVGLPLLDVELHAGDLLYFPRGFVHEARAANAASLHLTLGVQPCSWADLLHDALNQALEQHAELRRNVPVGLLRGQLPAEELQNQFQEMLGTLTARACLADAVDRHVRTFLDKLGPLSDGHLEQLGQVDGIKPDTVMCKRTGMICHVVERANLAVIHFPGNAIQGPPALGPAMHFIAEADRFAVGSLPGLSERGQQTLARRLFKAGLLTIVEPFPFDVSASSNG